MILIFSIFYVSFLASEVYAQNFSPKLDPDKFTICTVTINSDEEKKIFEAQALKHPKKFNPVVELTEIGDEDWFDAACKSGIRCDQLVISGHFAGSFFGKSEKTLGLEELETAGCSKSCPGILANPYEVFLFGCNTLAQKERDSRTPDQYLQVLLRDGIDRRRAEQIVQSRYGSMGDSNITTMKRAFSGEGKQLYGFDSIGPSGKSVKKFLENYFAQIKAPDRLEKLQARRLIGQIDNVNTELAKNLKVTAFSQCTTGKDDSWKTSVICGFLDKTKSTISKLDLLVEAIMSDEFLAIVPSINNFMNSETFDEMTERDKKYLQEIISPKLSKQILNVLNQPPSEYTAIDLGELAYKLSIIDQARKDTLIAESVKKLFARPLDDSDIEIICSNKAILYPNLQLKRTDLKIKSLSRLEIVALNCLNIRDKELLESMLTFDFGDDYLIFDNTLKTLIESDVKVTIPASFIKIFKNMYPQSKRHLLHSWKDRNAISFYKEYL